MMNEDIDDDEEEEEVILDRRNLIQKANNFDASSNSGPILFGINRFNIRIHNDPNKSSKEKAILLAITCISIGMLTGLFGPTFPFLAQSISAESSLVIRLIPIKAIGFLIGTFLSSYLYTWFNVYCLLGLSCLSISFGVCSLPYTTDLTAFYLASLILGIALAISYNGIDAFYNRLWARSSIRWLHLLVALGAILSTLMLLPAAISNDNNSSVIINVTESSRLRREIVDNRTKPFNLFTMQSTSTTFNVKTQSPFVETENLITESSSEKSICIKSYCCYHHNETVFDCQEEEENESNNCIIVLSLCQNSTSQVCIIDKNDISCRMDRICDDEEKPICSRQLIDTAINTSNSIIYVLSASTTTIPSTTKTDSTTIVTSTNTISSSTTIHRNKPSVAESAIDDLSTNLLYFKIRLFIQSLTSIHILYLLLAISFCLLGIFYSILAIRGENIDSLSIPNLNPLSLLFVKSHRIVNHSNSQTSLLSDRSSVQLIFLLILFYFILSGIESSCIYLTYLFGIKLNFEKRKSLLIQFCYLFGRLLDILFNYGLLYIKKQSYSISVKLLIFIRLLILFVICLMGLFQQIFSIQMLYFFFFSIGFVVTSLPSLILYWIERDLSLNDSLIRVILFTIIISEIICPIVLFSKGEQNLIVYLCIASCLLMILFIIILYISKKWQINRSYRLLSTAIEMDEIEGQDISDNENETPKGAKLH